jgi:membrane protein DedA with SNARE-associated domain/rhodanese-related sulfurtransferase
MRSTFAFVLNHGYLVIAVVSFVDQLGIPFPAVPFLVAAGALARSGQLSLLSAGLVALTAAIVAHTIWYEAARRERGDVLGFMCRVSLEPDVCVRRAHDFFARWGAGAVVLSNLVPGVGVVAQPIAGILRMSRSLFLGLNLLGAVVWAGLPLALGYGFSAQVESILEAAAQLGSSAVVLLAGALVAYLGWKVFRRRILYRALRLARITPEELLQRLERKEPLVVLDLRHELEFIRDHRMIPGALRMSPEELDQRYSEIPRDRDVVLYCSCPNEATSARAALRLIRRGITRVRPLAGGFPAWRAKGYALAPASE